MDAQPPLVVDLDGTLIRTDLLLETLVRALQRAPWLLLALPFWLLRGRAFLKRQLAQRSAVSPDGLPYRDEVVAWLRQERDQGRKLVLATASDDSLAQRVASHLGTFSEVVASDGRKNVKGAAKRSVLVERYGERGFDYAGNDAADLSVWASARCAIVVSNDAGLFNAASQTALQARRIPVRESGWGVFASAIRVRQWPKNLLVFAPLVLAHQVHDPQAWLHATLAFIAFCAVASAVYLINDLVDLDADRVHATKRRRPLASGDLGILHALALVPALLLVGVALAAWTSWPLVAALAVYAIVGFLYSALLKRFALVDIFVIAGLYTLRIQAGAFAVNVPVSDWLFAFSMFFFLSLALAKRHAELKRFTATHPPAERLPGRGYQAADAIGVGVLGTVAGYMSVVVLAFYITGREVMALYRHPGLLWITAVLMLFWITRVWLLSHRGELGEDPLSFALHDATSYVVGALMAITLAVAT